MATQNIGRYRILRELGRGATGTVYLARDPGSGRQVAVKVLAVAFTAAPDFDERFQREVKELAAFDHPYLVGVQDYGHDGEQYFVVMRYLPGGTLADRMDGRPMLLAEVVPILQRLAEALDAAHTVHLVHGDVNPANVLFDLHERAFVADVGLAHLLDPSNGPSPTGTPAYTSPEQVAGQPIDGRADVYALGVMLFEMLTGRQPFSAETPEQLLQKHVEQPLPALSAAALSQLVLPLEFNLVIARALAKIRDYRYPTAGVLAEAVRTMFLMAPADSSAAEPGAANAAPPAAVPPAPPPPPIEPLVAAPAEPPEPGPAPRRAAEAVVVPAVARTPASDSAPLPSLNEFVREPEVPPASRISPVLLGIAGFGMIVLLLAIWRWPDIKGFLIPPTATATATATVAPTGTPSDTPSPMPSATASASPSLTPTARPTLTPTASPTNTATITPSPSNTPTATPSATRRPILPTFTATP